MVTGELTRYALSMQSLVSLKAPQESALSWFTGVLIAKSLNAAFQTVIDNPKLQWVWVMGDDHVFAPDTLLRLLDREKDVIVPLCLNRVPPMDPTIVDHRYKRMKYLEELPSGGLYQLAPHETCGDAGLFIRRPVLEKLGPVWYDSRKSGALAAEDQAFVQRIKDAGYDVWVDLDNPIGHVGNVNFMPIKKKGKWEVRLIGGGVRHICDLGAVPRPLDAFVIPDKATPDPQCTSAEVLSAA